MLVNYNVCYNICVTWSVDCSVLISLCYTLQVSLLNRYDKWHCDNNWLTNLTVQKSNRHNRILGQTWNTSHISDILNAHRTNPHFSIKLFSVRNISFLRRKWTLFGAIGNRWTDDNLRAVREEKETCWHA